MARVTRSKKFNINEDQSAIDASDLVLGEPIVNSHFNEIRSVNAMAPIQDALAAELKGLKAAYRTAIGGGRKGTKRGRKQHQALPEHCHEEAAVIDTNTVNGSLPTPTVVQGIALDHIQEDATNGEVSTAPIPARRTTRRQAAKAQADEQLFLTTKEVIGDEGNNINNPTKTQAGVFNADAACVTRADFKSSEKVVDREEIGTRSKARSPVKTLEQLERDAPLSTPNDVQIDEEDSFVERITARSPAKLVVRIEDSVEALDQLEEALEALDAATLTEKLASPEKAKKSATTFQTHEQTVGDKFLERMRSLSHQRSGSPLQRSQSIKSGSSTVRVKSNIQQAPGLRKAASMSFRAERAEGFKAGTGIVASEQSTIKRPSSMIIRGSSTECGTHNKSPSQVLSRRPVSLLPPKETARSNKPLTQSTFELPGEAVGRRLREQREARLARREACEPVSQPSRAVLGPRVKSSKPLTVSNFELPGEALSRKRKEAHEAKMKAQEEEEKRRREFKARPPPGSTIPNVVPRDTVASRARLSRVGLENIDSSAVKRSSIISNVGAHRPTLASLTAANTSAPRAPGPSMQLQRKPSSTSVGVVNGSAKAVQRTVSASDVQVQRQRGKEIYDRDAKLTEEIERERREREAAAKRAREEAAERGRQASREWAERQLARRMAEGRSSSSGHNSVRQVATQQ